MQKQNADAYLIWIIICLFTACVQRVCAGTVYTESIAVEMQNEKILKKNRIPKHFLQHTSIAPWILNYWWVWGH